MTHPLTLTGAPNFRDLGGYATRSGQTERHRRLLRSEHLGKLAPDDLAAIASHLGKSVRVLDLRGAVERQSASCVIPGATVHSLPIEPTIVQKLTDLLEAGHRLTAAETVALMQDTYRGFVRGNTPRFASLFAHALEASDAPLVFHCTAGKDRTGFAAALLLLALGVPRDVVMHDYMLTNGLYQPPVASKHGLSQEVASVLWRVQPEFLEASFDAVDVDYGGVEGYLREGLGLGERERARLGEMYLHG